MILKYRRTENGYLSHFGFHEKPFGMSTDPKFLWHGEKRKEEREALLSAILYKDGYVVVTGDVGTGKTMLASAMMNGLANQVIAAKIPFPEVDDLDFLKLISTAYGISDGFQSKGSILVHFESFLRNSLSAGEKVVLIIDEAQKLTSANLKDLLHLSTIEENGAGFLNIVFVGQNEFNDMLLKESNRALRQRILINYRLEALTEEETQQYILHRLKVARGEKDIFTSEAIKEIFLFSEGIPRLINVVCDLALLNTYFESGKIVRAECVKKSLQRLLVPGQGTELGGNGSKLASGMERKDGSGIIEKMKSELGMQRRVRNRAQVWAAYAIGFALLVVFIGFLFYLHRPGQMQQNSTYEGVKKKVSQKNKMSSRMKEGNPGAASSAMEKPVLPDGAGKGSDSAVRPKEDSAPKEVNISKGTSAQGVKTERQVTAGSRDSARPAKQTFTTPLREEMGPYEKKTRIDDKGKAASEERGERMAQTPGFAIGQSGQESTNKDVEEIDPSRVIEWLLERRSDKK